MGKKFVYLTKKLFLPPVRRFFRPEPRGIEHLPDPPAIIIPNQTSGWDGCILNAEFVYRGLPEIKFAVMDTAGHVANKASFGLLRLFLDELGCVRLPKRGESTEDYLEDRVKKVFQEGHYFGMFPEGRLVREEGLGPYYPGAFKLAAALNVPVVPVFMNIYQGRVDKRTPIYIGPQLYAPKNGSTNGALHTFIAQARDTTYDLGGNTYSFKDAEKATI